LKTKSKNNSKGKVIAIIVVICLILLIAVLAVLFYFRSTVPKNPTGTVGNTSGNLYNGGLFCESDGYVYFSNAYDKDSLYRMLPDETEVTKLSESSMTSINADSKFLYCYLGGVGTGTGLGFLFDMNGVYRILKSDPSDYTCLDRVEGQYVLLADNDVYYTSNSSGQSLKKVSTNGKNIETLLDIDLLPVSVQNSTFYYMNNEDSLHLMAYDLKSQTSRQVLGDDVYMPIIEGNMVYGIDVHDGYSLVSINVSDGTKTLLDSDRTDILNVSDTYIYYQTSGETPQLKRIRRDGSDMAVIAEGAYNSINATSQYVYFTKYGTTTPVYHTPSSGQINVTTFQAAADAANNG
jgi:hypothetical protein